MKLQFKQLGSLYQGELELADLTIICGENNTGKTYITYALYGLLKLWKNFAEFEPSRKEIETLEETGVLNIDLKAKLEKNHLQLKSELSKNYLKNLHEILASRTDLFKDTELFLDFQIGDSWQKKSFTDEIRSKKGKALLTIYKPENSTRVEFVATEEESEEIPSFAYNQWIEEALLDIVLGDVFPKNVLMASTERTGSVIFKDELNLTKNRLLDLIAQEHNSNTGIKPNELLNTVYRKQSYALPVRRNLEFVNQLAIFEKQDSYIVEKHPEIIKQFSTLLGGEFKTNKEGMTYFIPNGNKKLKLQLGEASSSVRSLLIVWYYLRHLLEKGDMLMIDEPELNLHPVNQRRFARLIAQLINAGIKIFITTHSDYIIKELNTLIMFNRELPHYKAIKEKKGYASDEKINPEKIAIYSTKLELIEVEKGKRRQSKNILKPIIPIDERFGIGIEAFDESIKEMNAIQDAILYGE